MIPENYWIYLQIIFFLFITPGSPRILMCSYTMSYSLKKTIWTALGDITANTMQLFLVVVGLGLLVKNNPVPADKEPLTRPIRNIITKPITTSCGWHYRNKAIYHLSLLFSSRLLSWGL